MSQFVESACRTDTAAGALAQYLRVKTPGALALAGASDPMIGTVENPCLAAGPCTVRLRTAQGTRKMVASEAISVGVVYAAASGKIASTGTVVEGYALEAAGANNDVIEVMGAANTDVSTATTGTTGASFTVDSDATTPKLKIQGQAAGSGDYTTTLKPESTLSGDNTILVPEADGDTLVAVALAQTLTNKTLTSPVLNAMPKFQNTVTPVAAAGSTVADAGQLASTIVNHITSDGATKGVKFPTGAQNHLMIVINNSGTAAELYAASGGTINGLSADASVVIPASKGVIAFATGADTWIAFDLPAKATAS